MTFPGAPEAPEQAPAAEGGQAPEGQPEGGAQAPAGADPRVLEQMSNQLQQFGGVVGQMAEYLPAMQQLAQSQTAGEPEPSLEELAAQFFGGDDGGQGEPLYDPYTGDPVQQQQVPPQGGLQGDPNQLVELFRQVAREQVAPLQERLQREDQQRQQEAWSRLYEEFPQFQDPQTAPQIAERVASAARLFGRSPEEAERFANDPAFVRMVHLSSVNEARGQGETPAASGDGAQPIEAGGGASAPGAAEIDPGDAIVGAGRGGGGGEGSHFR